MQQAAPCPSLILMTPGDQHVMQHYEHRVCLPRHLHSSGQTKQATASGMFPKTFYYEDLNWGHVAMLRFGLGCLYLFFTDFETMVKRSSSSEVKYKQAAAQFNQGYNTKVVEDCLHLSNGLY